MTITEFEDRKKEAYNKIFEEFKQLNKEFIQKNCSFKVGDYVKVFWNSRDYGKESSIAVIRFIGVRHHGYLGFMYYFNKINKTGKESKHPLPLPKHSRIYKMIKLEKD